MHLKPGEPIRVTVTAKNQDGTPQAKPVVDFQLIPLVPVPPETSLVTMYEIKLTNSQGGTATESVGVTVSN